MFHPYCPRSLFLLISGVTAVSFSPGLQALQLRSYSSARHDRLNNFPAAPTANAQFMHAALDLTGVGWNADVPQQQFTLISPRHFAGANHYRPAIGGTIRFLSAEGTVVSRQISALAAMPNAQGQATDLLIGTLNMPVEASTGVRHLPYLNLVSEAAYSGRTVAFLGRQVRGGRGSIGVFSDFGGDPITAGAGINSTRTFALSYSTLGGSTDDAYAEVGDSGSPSLATEAGQAALVGIHTAVLNVPGSITTVDTFLPAYTQQANAHMETLGYHLTQATPEPVNLTLSAAGPAQTIRAGYPFTITAAAGNSAPLSAAHNVRLALTSAPGLSWDASAAGGWVPEVPGTARRGGLNAGQTASVTFAAAAPEPGALSLNITVRSDGSTTVSTPLSLQVIESYRSWSRDLPDPAAEADPDRDGIDNLTEYAFGGDPQTASMQAGASGTSLLPLLSANGTSLTWLRRRDAGLRALSYAVEYSSSLAAASWQPVSGSTESGTPLDQQFEQVVTVIPAGAAARRFYRIRTVLAE